MQKGQFVDDYDPPVMREIQYDLSPEKMQKVWVSYFYSNASSITKITFLRQNRFIDFIISEVYIYNIFSMLSHDGSVYISF